MNSMTGKEKAEVALSATGLLISGLFLAVEHRRSLVTY